MILARMQKLGVKFTAVPIVFLNVLVCKNENFITHNIYIILLLLNYISYSYYMNKKLLR